MNLYLKIRELARRSPDKEIGGYVKDSVVFALENISPEPQNTFCCELPRGAAPDYLFHSHINDLYPSKADCDISRRLGSRIIIYCLKSDSFCVIDPFKRNLE